MSHTLEKQLQHARPSLKVVSPLSYYIVMIYALLNILLGISFLIAIDQNRVSASLIIVNNLLTYKVWGIVFVAVGVMKLFALHVNNWDLTRKSLLVGVALKAAWMIALTVRIFISPGTILVTSLWVALAAVQIVTYIFFMPPSVANFKQRREDREHVK